ncbi:sigma 54-interacting transcriptional regulator [Clostridiaceae bacterium 35-E11]
MKVKELMTPKPIVLRNKDTIMDAAAVFVKWHIDGAPVLNIKDEITGIFTKTDLMKAFIDRVSPLTPLVEIACKAVQTIEQEADIMDAWNIKVGRLPVVDRAGKLVGILTRTDLSKKLLSKEKQEVNELKAILNSSNNGIVIIDETGKITRCNPSAVRILNLTSEDSVIGKNAQRILPELRLYETIEKGYSQYTEKIKFQDKTLIGDRILLIQNEKITGAVSVFQDSSGLQNVIDELNEVQKISQRLDAVIESSYDGIYITDGKANTLRINKSYERITGVKREEMLGKNMLELEKASYISESATLKVLTTGKTTTIHQKFRTGKNALVTSTPIFDNGGKISMVVTNVRDVTELAHLKEQLEANKELAKRYYSEIKEMRLQILNTADLVVEDEKMLETMRIAKRVAKVDTTVLLLGETGVGKEEVAKFIHKNSHRKKHQFIKINCGAIPENLIESELFGYEKGAFTGANKEGKVGLFEIADGGTLFLDEVGELSLDMQVKLLRVLQEQEIKRVGGIRSIKIDTRILAATNRDLEEMVKTKLFREDLYYRLNVVPLNIPPLRERRQDILPLVQHFLSVLNEKYQWNKFFHKDVLDTLYEYDWPGNVRELKNIVERVFIMSNQDNITVEDLPKSICAEREDKGLIKTDQIMPLKDAVALVEKQLIRSAFEKHGNVRSAAKVLGIDASTFVRKRRKYEET